MCFSVQVDRDINWLARHFGAGVSHEDLEKFYQLKNSEETLGVENLKKLLGLKRKPRGSFFKGPGEDHRIYPNYFTDVMVMENGKRVFKKMRYRVRPANSVEEIPSKYNVFNSRIDSLEKRRTWQGIFMRNHGLFPFNQFYEWVERDGKSTLIKFQPDHHEIMWAPCLYDTWKSLDGEIEFSSFALITDDPPPEVQAMGHDRCPIFLRENLIDQWLTPEGKSKEDIYELLKQIEKTLFAYEWAA